MKLAKKQENPSRTTAHFTISIELLAFHLFPVLCWYLGGKKRVGPGGFGGVVKLNLIAFMPVFQYLVCMELDNAQLEKSPDLRSIASDIAAAVKTNDKHNKLRTLLSTFKLAYKEQPPLRQISGKQLLAEAIQSAQKNLVSTEKRLTLSGNPSRLLLGAYGTIQLCFGLSKGSYDFFLYSEPTTEPVENGFSAAANGALVLNGIKNLVDAYQNTVAVNEHQKALMLQYMITSATESVKKSVTFSDPLELLEEKKN